MSSKSPLTLPPSFLHVTLSTPYRSTSAITSLARFIAKCEGLAVPEGDLGSDVDGIKPIFFDVGKDERKMKEALKHCRKHLGDNATILYEDYIPDSIKKLARDQGKESGGTWDRFDAGNFYGWEAEIVVAVTGGFNIMELITRARNMVAVIVVEGKFAQTRYIEIKKFFQQAADEGLIEVVHLGDGEPGNKDGEEEDKEMKERERALEERERALLERERMVAEKEKILVEEKEKMLEKEKILVEEKETMLEKERMVAGRERILEERDSDHLSRNLVLDGSKDICSAASQERQTGEKGQGHKKVHDLISHFQ